MLLWAYLYFKIIVVIALVNLFSFYLTIIIFQNYYHYFYLPVCGTLPWMTAPLAFAYTAYAQDRLCVW